MVNRFLLKRKILFWQIVYLEQTVDYDQYTVIGYLSVLSEYLFSAAMLQSEKFKEGLILSLILW